MKNIELYRTIESLVGGRREKSNPTKRSFAHDYCKRQIQKKKLIPFNPSSKMNRIMQNFHQLDTYVNVEQLFDYVNQLIAEKKKEETENSMKNMKWIESNTLIPFDNQTIEKVKEKLGPYNSKRNMKEASMIKTVAQRLENDSNIENLRKENNKPEGNYNYIVKSLSKNPDSFNAQEKYWNHYEDTSYSVCPKQEPCKSLSVTQSEHRVKLKEKQERAGLIHQVSTYLQIILESQHRKKWQNSVPGIKNEKLQKIRLGKKSVFKVHSSRNSISKLMLNKTEGVGIEKSIESSKRTTVPSSPRKKVISPLIKKKSSLESSRKMKDTFTFRNRNIKRSLMKKIDNFLDYVETEQKNLKKDKNQVIAEISRLESKYRNNGGTICLPDDHQIRAVQHIVHMQR